MTVAPIHIAGTRLMLDPAGALLWPEQGLMVVSDLHLEKGTAFARQGMLLPPWDTRATLDRLAMLMRRHRPRTVIALGDSFHDRTAAARLPAAEIARIIAMTSAARFIWVLGNHDPEPATQLGGDWVDEFSMGSLIFRHQGKSKNLRLDPEGEICGHHHPKAAITVRGGVQSRACFVTDANRVMLPAFGAYTGGLDVTHPEIARLFPLGGRVFLLGRERLFSFAMAVPKRGVSR